MKEFKLCGLGNALVDIFLEVTEEEFKSLGFQRGGMQLVDLAEQRKLLERYQKHEPKLVSGGSVANSVIAFTHTVADRVVLPCLDPCVKAARLVGPRAVVRMIRLLAAVQ